MGCYLSSGMNSSPIHPTFSDYALDSYYAQQALTDYVYNPYPIANPDVARFMENALQNLSRQVVQAINIAQRPE